MHIVDSTVKREYFLLWLLQTLQLALSNLICDRFDAQLKCWSIQSNDLVTLSIADSALQVYEVKNSPDAMVISTVSNNIVSGQCNDFCSNPKCFPGRCTKVCHLVNDGVIVHHPQWSGALCDCSVCPHFCQPCIIFIQSNSLVLVWVSIHNLRSLLLSGYSLGLGPIIRLNLCHITQSCTVSNPQCPVLVFV